MLGHVEVDVSAVLLVLDVIVVVLVRVVVFTSVFVVAELVVVKVSVLVVSVLVRLQLSEQKSHVVSQQHALVQVGQKMF